MRGFGEDLYAALWVSRPGGRSPAAAASALKSGHESSTLSRWRARLAHPAAALLVSMNIVMILGAGGALAQNATWVGPGAEWTTGTNWSPTAAPTGTATFTNNGAPQDITISNTAGVDEIVLTPGLLNFYSFVVEPSVSFSLSGVGVINNSATVANFPNGGTFSFLNSSTAANSNITNTSGAYLEFYNTSTAGNAAIGNSGIFYFYNSSTAANATITNNAGGIIQFLGTSTAGSATITNSANGVVNFDSNSNAGNARLINNAGGTVDFSLSTGLTGNNKLSAGSIEGGGNFYLGANQLTAGSNNLSTTVSGVISDCGSGTQCNYYATNSATPTGGSLVKTGTGTLTLSAANTYTGPTNVNSGVLEVDGSIASSSLTTVSGGAMLQGVGTVGNTTIAGGGMFNPGSGTPGSSMAVTGNLAFQSGAAYLVQVNTTTASLANVGGTASLNGTVQAAFAPGSYVSRQYDILHSAGLGGTAFATFSTTNLPSNFTAKLSYTSTDVLLNLTSNLGGGGGAPGVSATGLNLNQRNVANSLNNFFNGGGTLTPNFATVFGLSGASLANALTQIDGEAATGAERGAFQMMTGFLGLMLDPFVDGRFASSGFGSGQAIGFAPEEQQFLPPDVALAYASVLGRASPPPPFAQRWTAWVSAYGGSNAATGSAAVGSSNLTASTFGFAAGMDYHFSPDTIFGFALGGGGTNWGLATTPGSGHSDAMQIGVYGITRAGPAYLSGALAFANHWFTTSRGAMGDQLQANFDGQSYGARLESGYCFGVLPSLGVTPYAALQAQDFHTPGYSESDLSAGGFGLSYAAMNATDVRTELGSRFDDSTLVAGMPLILRSKIAWAHDFVGNPALSAAFESLPGSNFIVNGAAMPHDSALVSAGAELFLTQRWTLLAKFDGEFANGSQTYGGSGTLRYSW
jgi:autotransporter-associated beta strand protein